MLERLSPKQKNFLIDVINKKTARINILDGSVRSGKTFVSLIAWILLIAEYPIDSTFLMVGKTITSLKRNCLTLLQNFTPDFSFSISKKEATLYGRKIYLEGVNDSRSENKIRGMTLTGAYCDELTLFTEDFFSMLLSRLSMHGSKLLATTNPDSPNHWLNKKYLNRKELNLKTWKFLLEDNYAMDQDVIKEIKKEYTGVFYERFILGKWVTAEGLIYRVFVDDKKSHLIDKPQESFSFISIGIDYGASKSKTVFIATGITNSFKKVIVLKEKALIGVHDPEEIYEQFEIFYNLIFNEYGKPNFVFADYGSLGEVITKGLKIRCIKKGIAVKIENCFKSTINDRIQLTCQLLSQKRLKIRSECKGLINAFENSIWDNKKIDVRLDDGTVEIDYLDAFEYSINNFAKYFVVPK